MQLDLRRNLRWVIWLLCVQCSIVIQPGGKGLAGLIKTVLNHSRFMLRRLCLPLLLFWMVIPFLFLRLLLQWLIQFSGRFILLLTLWMFHHSDRSAGLWDCYAVAFFMDCVCRRWSELRTYCWSLGCVGILNAIGVLFNTACNCNVCNWPNDCLLLLLLL